LVRALLNMKKATMYT